MIDRLREEFAARGKTLPPDLIQQLETLVKTAAEEAEKPNPDPSQHPAQKESFMERVKKIGEAALGADRVGDFATTVYEAVAPWLGWIAKP